MLVKNGAHPARSIKTLNPKPGLLNSNLLGSRSLDPPDLVCKLDVPGCQSVKRRECLLRDVDPQVYP